MMRHLTPQLYLALALTFSLPQGVQAEALPDLGSLPDSSSVITPAISNAFVKTIGLGTGYRAYEPATPLGTKLGLSTGIEITLAKIPPDLDAAMVEAGGEGNSGSLGLPVLPVPVFHLHKGFGSKVDIGFSGILYNQGYSNIKPLRIYGGDIKFVLYEPEEGPTYAIRLNYSRSKIMYFSTSTWSPQFLVSRAMSFANPYIGLGYQHTTGKIEFPIQVLGKTISLKNTGTAGGFIAFTGVQFRIFDSGIQLTMEGSYSSAGVHTLGTKIGLVF